MWLTVKYFFKPICLNKAIGITISVKRFQNSIDATTTWYPNLMSASNLYLNKACRDPNCMVTLCINLEKLLDGMIFPINWEK